MKHTNIFEKFRSRISDAGLVDAIHAKRELLRAHLARIKEVSHCLDRETTVLCPQFDKVMAELPALDLTDSFKSAKEEIASKSFLSASQCLANERREKEEWQKLKTDAAQTLALMAFTGLAGRLAEGARLSAVSSRVWNAIRGAEAFPTLTKVASGLSKAQKAKMAFLGLDLAALGASGSQVISECSELLNGIEIESGPLIPPASPSCEPDQRVRAKRDFGECVQRAMYGAAMVGVSQGGGRVASQLASRIASRFTRARRLILKPQALTMGEMEIPKTGIILGSGKVKDLKDGVYIYVIEKKLGPIYQHRTPNINGASRGGAHMASHRSLLNAAKDAGGGDVVAAGEFTITNGKVSHFNNRSGTFRGDVENGNGRRHFQGSGT